MTPSINIAAGITSNEKSKNMLPKRKESDNCSINSLSNWCVYCRVRANHLKIGKKIKYFLRLHLDVLSLFIRCSFVWLRAVYEGPRECEWRAVISKLIMELHWIFGWQDAKREIDVFILFPFSASSQNRFHLNFWFFCCWLFFFDFGEITKP